MKIYLFLLYSISPFRIQKVSGSRMDDLFSFFAMVSSTADVFIAWLRRQSKSQVLGLLASWSHLALVIFLQLMLCITFARGCLLLQHGRENCCELMGRSRRRCGRPACAAHPAQERPQRAGARAETLRGHAQGATGPIVDPPTARSEHCAATDAVLGTEPQPGRTRLVRRPLTHSEPHCGEDDGDRWSVSARHVGRGFVALRLPMGGRGWGERVVVRIDQGITSAEARSIS